MEGELYLFLVVVWVRHVYDVTWPDALTGEWIGLYGRAAVRGVLAGIRITHNLGVLRGFPIRQTVLSAGYSSWGRTGPAPPIFAFSSGGWANSPRPVPAYSQGSWANSAAVMIVSFPGTWAESAVVTSQGSWADSLRPVVAFSPTGAAPLGPWCFLWPGIHRVDPCVGQAECSYVLQIE